LKFIYFIFLSLIAFSCHVNDNSQQEISNVLKNQTDEWNKGNVDGFMQGYWNSKELRFITKRGIKFGYDSVSNGYKRSYNTKEKMGELTFSKLQFFDLNGKDLKQVFGMWKVSKINETDSGNFSLIFKQIDGHWKIIIDHTW